jgi:hypothetical protein
VLLVGHPQSSEFFISRSPNTPPTSFYATVVIEPIIGLPGIVAVTGHPISRSGEPCLIECGHVITMTPDISDHWVLKDVEIIDDYVEYTATNERTWVMRYLRILRMWSVEGRLDEANRLDNQNEVQRITEIMPLPTDNSLV